MASSCQQTVWVILSSPGTSYDVAIISVGYGLACVLETHGSYFMIMSYEHLALSDLLAACLKCTISALKIHYSWYFWNGHNYTSKRTFGLLGLGGFPLLHRIILSITVNQMLFNQTHLAWHFPGEVCFRNEVCAAWQRAHKHLCRMTFPNIGSWPLRLVSLTWWVR